MNENIRAHEVLLIDHEGRKIGAVPKHKAQQMAHDVELDLVEVNPNGKPPVCKIMDYGKFKYERSKKEHIAAKKQHQVKVKEIRISAKIGEHDLDVKIRNAREMLISGDRVEFSLRFKGREITHREIGKELMNRVKEMLGDVAIVESGMKSMGKVIRMLLAPDKRLIDKIIQERQINKKVIESQRKSKRSKRQEKISQRLQQEESEKTKDADAMEKTDEQEPEDNKS
ncbi:MAG: translation initiation factor IF-3 [Planctomycetes bacterium]|nr:translation initiation factor IF-3 [Planctomycetota bacterium]